MSNLTKNDLFEKIELVKHLRDLDSPFLHNLQVIFESAQELTANRTPIVFPNYTLHDIQHSIRVADYMYSILKNKIKNIPELNIVISLYTAILHDIGMVVSEDEILEIKSDNYTDIQGEKYGIQLSGIKNISWIKNITCIEEQEKTAIQEYVRRIHGFRSRQFVEKLHKKDPNLFNIPLFPSVNIHEEIGLICESHNESYDWIKSKLKPNQTKGKYTYSTQFCACILRLADIIEIDERRTPPILFENINPNGRSLEEWLQHRVIQNAEKVIHDGDRLIFKFEGECNDAKIHRKIYHYLDWIKEELIGSKALLKNLLQDYFLDIETDIIRNIEAIGSYTIPDNKMSVDYRTVSTLLMGDRIYGDRKYGLRELIQNSIDACKIRLEEENKNKKIGDEPYIPTIKIILDKANNSFMIKDNGIGMDLDIIQNHFLSIGRSYYKSDNFKIHNYSFHPIGNFGIGFLSCYMLSNNVIVNTQYFNSPITYKIELEQGEEYSCIEETRRRVDGTEIILAYDQVMTVFSDAGDIQSFIKEHITSQDIQFKIYNKNKEKRIDIKLRAEYDKSKEFSINIEKYINNIEGYLVLERNKIVYRNLGEFDIDAAIFYYNKDGFLKDRDLINNIELSHITEANILNYVEVSFYDTKNYEDISYFIFYENKMFDIHFIEEEAKKHIIVKKLEEYPDATYDVYHHQMYIYNANNKYKYSIPYYSDHVESQNMVDIDEHKYQPIGNFSHGSFHLGPIFNNGILVSNEEYYIGFEYDHYTRFTSLEISRYSLNIKKGLDLNISRTNFIDHKELETINYAILKAAHMAVYFEFDLNEEELLVLKEFLKENYPQESIYNKNIEEIPFR